MVEANNITVPFLSRCGVVSSVLKISSLKSFSFIVGSPLLNRESPDHTLKHHPDQARKAFISPLAFSYHLV